MTANSAKQLFWNRRSIAVPPLLA